MIDLFPVNPLLVAAIYYLFGRAEVTRWLWSRYPVWLDELSMCPACSGFWIGLATGLVQARGLGRGAGWSLMLQAGLVSLVTTPILFGLMRGGLPRIIPLEPEPPLTPLDEKEPEA